MQLAAGGIARGPLPLATVPLSSGNVDAEGVYLLENGSEAWLYFGGQAPPQLVHDLLGAFHCLFYYMLLTNLLCRHCCRCRCWQRAMPQHAIPAGAGATSLLLGLLSCGAG